VLLLVTTTPQSFEIADLVVFVYDGGTQVLIYVERATPPEPLADSRDPVSNPSLAEIRLPMGTSSNLTGQVNAMFDSRLDAFPP
jgi:hypothetical protein